MNHRTSTHGWSARRALVLLALTVLAAGCVNLAREAPAKRYFAPEVERSSGPPLVSIEERAALRVEPCRMSPTTDQAPFVLRVGEHEYIEDFYSEFLVDPSAWIQFTVADWFRASGLFESVDTGGSLRRPELHWETWVPALHLDVREESGPVAVLEIRGALVRDGKVLWQGGSTYSEPMADASSEAGAAAWARALARACEEWERRLAENVERWSGTPASKD